MALHMHEVMQRFSSVAAEQQIDEKKVDVRKPDEKKSQDETHRLSHAAVDS
jgi:hypothetical protein